MSTSKRILVTGANGFIGRAVMQRISDAPHREPVGVVRNLEACCEAPWSCDAVGEIGRDTDWSGVLKEVDVVVHTAARAYVIAETEVNPRGAYREVNVAGTRRLADQAAEAGVRRFVFLSSIKVNGEATTPGSSFGADQAPAPEDAYGQSKLEAEQVLMDVSERSGLEVVIIRPPLVYGPGVKGNFASLMNWVGKGMPLPLGAIKNRRSLVALENLVDLITVCIDHPAAANEVFLAADGEDLSTPELLRRLGKAMGRPARLLPVPPGLLTLGAGMLGKGDMARRLLGSLQVDIFKARDVLGWEPPISVDEGLRRAVEPCVRCDDE